MLVGRAAEQGRIAQLLSAAREGRSGVLVLRGEAGVGKTALLDHAVTLGEGMTAVRSTGVESEAELEFSALLEVCRPLLDLLDEVPAPQAEALCCALGIEVSEACDRFAIGAATLSLLAAAGERRPLLVVVDDAQWLDSASYDALRFAGRRLVADPVALIFAVREGEGRPFELSGAEELAIGGLDPQAARALLEDVSGAVVPADVAARLHAATNGNALALRELPSVLSADQLAGREPLDEPLPTGASVGKAFAGRAAGLPEASRRALVILSVSTAEELDTVVRALGRFGVGPDALEPAEDAGLVRVANGRIEFSHPLVRSAVHQSAPGSERRAAHRALAEALAETGDADRRAWHLGAATLEPDEEVAAALEDAGRRAFQRSGYSAAAAALERAARLSPDETVRLERLEQAAQAAWEGGSPERAVRLLDEALVRCDAPRLRSSTLHLRGQIEHLTGDQVRANDMLTEAATLVEQDDPALAALILVDATETCLFGGNVRAAVSAARWARALAPADGSPEDVLADLVLGETLFLTAQVEEGVPMLERTLATIATSEELLEHPRYVARASVAHGLLERAREGTVLALRGAETARARGGVSALSYALEAAAWNDVRAGHWSRAVAEASEALALARETGQVAVISLVLVHLALVAAGRGEEAACRRYADEVFALADQHGLENVREWVRCALGLLEVGLGHLERAVELYEEAARRSEALEIFDRDIAPRPELVELHARLGHEAQAQEHLDAYLAFAESAAPVYGAAVAARCRGILAGEADFEARFQEALDAHERLEDEFARARTLLCFGERLRRAGQRREARERLNEALGVFETLGAAPWAERARGELRASGEKLRRRDAETADELTPQELQIALQVAEGKTNREVGAALFLSHKTVEYHLARIYRKLDVRSRSELIKRFASLPAA